MLLYFKSRETARQFRVGKLVDNGKDMPTGKRFARDISGLSKMTRKAIVNNSATFQEAVSRGTIS